MLFKFSLTTQLRCVFNNIFFDFNIFHIKIKYNNYVFTLHFAFLSNWLFVYTLNSFYLYIFYFHNIILAVNLFEYEPFHDFFTKNIYILGNFHIKLILLIYFFSWSNLFYWLNIVFLIEFFTFFGADMTAASVRPCQTQQWLCWFQFVHFQSQSLQLLLRD